LRKKRRTIALHHQIGDALPPIPAAQPLKVGDDESLVAMNRDARGMAVLSGRFCGSISTLTSDCSTANLGAQGGQSDG